MCNILLSIVLLLQLPPILNEWISFVDPIVLYDLCTLSVNVVISLALITLVPARKKWTKKLSYAIFTLSLWYLFHYIFITQNYIPDVNNFLQWIDYGQTYG